MTENKVKNVQQTEGLGFLRLTAVALGATIG